MNFLHLYLFGYLVKPTVKKLGFLGGFLEPKKRVIKDPQVLRMKPFLWIMFNVALPTLLPFFYVRVELVCTAIGNCYSFFIAKFVR